jgi:DNA-binding phage protein
MASSLQTQKRRPKPRFRDFDDFLDQRGIKSEVKAAVNKRIVAYLLEERRKECNLSKAELARMVGTSRTQIDRVLDPRSQNVTLDTLNRVARAMGKRIQLELVD